MMRVSFISGLTNYLWYGSPYFGTRHTSDQIQPSPKVRFIEHRTVPLVIRRIQPEDEVDTLVLCRVYVEKAPTYPKAEVHVVIRDFVLIAEALSAPS